MKLIAEVPSGTLSTIITVNSVGVMATAIKSIVGVGNPFLMFATISGTVVAANFDLHTDWAGFGNVVSASANENAQMIQAMLDNPPIDAITTV